MQARFRSKSAAIIYETFDDEVVIVNLDSGDYYSLSDAGVICWESLLSGRSIGATVDAVTASYEATEGEVEEALRNLIESLLENELIVPIDGGAEVETPPVQPTRTAEEKPRFVPPVLSQYSDMRDLLLIDPIHDVDETGWPEVKNEPKPKDKE